MPLAADFAITVGSEVSYNELAQLSSSVINNLNAPDLRSDVGGLWDNFVIAERMKWNHNRGLFPNIYFWRSSYPRLTSVYEKTHTGSRLSLALLINRR